MGRAGARHWTPSIGLVGGLRGYANQSLSHVEPVSGSRKRKLKNGEQRLAPENYRPGSKSLETTSQRRGRGSLTRGNVDGYPTPGNHDAETALGGWAARIRTRKRGSNNRVCFFLDALPHSFTRRERQKRDKNSVSFAKSLILWRAPVDEDGHHCFSVAL